LTQGGGGICIHSEYKKNLYLQKSKAKNAVRLMKCSRLSEGGNHHDGTFMECGGTGVFDHDAALG
jgi:hypothetical protein